MYTVLVSLLRLVCAVSLAAILRLASDSIRTKGCLLSATMCEPTSADMFQTSSDAPFSLSVCKVTFFNHIYNFFFRKYANFAVQSFAQFVNK